MIKLLQALTNIANNFKILKISVHRFVFNVLLIKKSTAGTYNHCRYLKKI